MQKKLNFPPHFVENIAKSHGSLGKAWLNHLPNIISLLAEKWQLTNLWPVENLSISYILKGNMENKNDKNKNQQIKNQQIKHKKVILKLTPTNIQINHEIETLNIYNGNGCVKLLNFDKENNALLLEAIIPGTTLKALFPKEEIKSIKICCQIIKKLHKNKLQISTSNLNFPKIKNWLESLNSNFSEIPIDLYTKARILAKELIESQSNIVLLHGDLHHENILLQADKEKNLQWKSIDPKGVLGESAYEVAAFIRNPIDKLHSVKNLKDLFAKRFEQFSLELNLDKKRIIQWSFVQAVLSACWFVEDKGDCKDMLNYARVFESFID